MSLQKLQNQSSLTRQQLDQFNPDWKQAQSHGRACMPGINKSKTLSKATICSCCLNCIQKDPVPLCQHSKELQFLGYGFPLYFLFLKYSIILLLMLVMTYSIIGLRWATDPELQDVYVQCVAEACPSWLLYASRLDVEVDTDQIVIRFTSFFIHLLGLLYFRNTLQKTAYYLNQRDCSMSDYSILITGLPHEKGMEKKLRQFFGKSFSTQPKLQDVLLMNQLDAYYKTEKKKNKLIQQSRKHFRHEKKDTPQKKQKMKKFIQQLGQLEVELRNEYLSQKKLIQNDEVICDRAIIILSSEEIKQKVLQEFDQMQMSARHQYFEGDISKMKMKTAPEPKQIIWQNFNYSSQKKMARFAASIVLTLLTLGIISVVFFFILQAKGLHAEEAFEEIKSNPDAASDLLVGVEAAVFCSVFLIIIFNKFILSKLLHLFTDIEKQYTGSNSQMSFCFKYAFGLFWTTACMTLLVQDARFHNIYTTKWGIIEEESLMFFLVSFFVPLIWLVNPWAIVAYLKQRYYYGRQDLTQREANHVMQKVEYSMGKRYAEILEEMWFAFLYSSVIPIGPMLLICGMLCFYWIDKYNLLRRSSIGANISVQMPLRAMKLLDLTLLFKPLGQIIFDTQIRGGLTYEPIVCISIAAVYILLPTSYLLDIFANQKFYLEQKTYTEAKSQFHETYRTLHPLYYEEREDIIKEIIAMRVKNAETLESERRAHLHSQINLIKQQLP